MGKFDELTALALQKAERFSDLNSECNAFAAGLVRALRTYLESPARSVYCDEVDRDHRRKNNPRPLPDLCFCYDTFWYFYLGFDFPGPEHPAYSVGLLVGLKKTSSGFTVKLPDKDFRLDDTNQQSDLFDYLLGRLREILSRPWTQEAQTLGFITLQ